MPSQHTPGPWEWADDPLGSAIVKSGECDICDVLRSALPRRDYTADSRRDECVANARLIAAAPDLLDAAQCAEALIRNGGIVPIKGKTWSQLRAAIAKARGDSA